VQQRPLGIRLRAFGDRVARMDPIRDRMLEVVEHLGMHPPGARLGMEQPRRNAYVDHAFRATSTSSSIFFASPNSMRLLSL
jgi:hypothetical protein